MSGYVVGDIHGMFGKLKTLLEKVGFNKSRDILYSVGDLCDRGSENLKTVRYLYSLGSSFKGVFGNHDIWLYDYLCSEYSGRYFDADNSFWLMCGGEMTYDEFCNIDLSEKEQYKDWFGNFNYCLRVDNNCIMHDFCDKTILEQRLRKTYKNFVIDYKEVSNPIYSIKLSNARKSGLLSSGEFDRDLFSSSIASLIMHVCDLISDGKKSQVVQNIINKTNEYIKNNFDSSMNFIAGHTITLASILKYKNMTLIDTGAFVGYDGSSDDNKKGCLSIILL